VGTVQEGCCSGNNLGSKLCDYHELAKYCANVFNPAMGGIKAVCVKIDALGGYSGIVSDRTAIQFKMLNKSKGPAMWSPRVQSDRMRLPKNGE
jgi:tRNA uridine 5-carboxymethylaminomethyl modification enzyme